jgi:hypothetical protein
VCHAVTDATLPAAAPRSTIAIKRQYDEKEAPG